MRCEHTSSEDASLQDKLSLGDNSTGFNVTSGDGTNKIILSISDEDFSNISLSQNQEHVLEVLRNVKYSNDANINLISGFRDLKLTLSMKLMKKIHLLIQ